MKTSNQTVFFTPKTNFTIRVFFSSALLFALMMTVVTNTYATALSNVEACYYNCKDGGKIAASQTITKGSTPKLLEELSTPTCEVGEREYMWMYYSSKSGGWQIIPNSKSKEYQPGEIYRTTYFMRCIRIKGCPTYRESNMVRISVVDCMPSGIEYEEACAGKRVYFKARKIYTSKPITYEWSFEGDASSSTASGLYANVIWASKGTKKVKLRVRYGYCDFTYEKTVYVEDCVCKDFYCRVSSESDCGVGWASASAYGGMKPYSYKWSNGATTRSVSDLDPGYHTVYITDANGCVCSKRVYIKPAKRINCDAYVYKDISSCDAYDGKVCAKGSGGSGYYKYRWSTGQYGRCISGLGKGTYYVTVTDKKYGCKKVCKVTLGKDCCKEFDVMVRKISKECSPPSIKVTFSGGIPGCSYSWAANFSKNGFGVSAHGWFVNPTEVMLLFDDIDFNSSFDIDVLHCKPGCPGKSIEFPVGPQPEDCCDLSCDIAVTKTPDCTDPTGSLKATVSGGSGSYTYTWFDSEGNNVGNGSTSEPMVSLEDVPPGDYNLYVVDLNNVYGCPNETRCYGSLSEPVDCCDVECKIDGIPICVDCSNIPSAFPQGGSISAWICHATGSSTNPYRLESPNCNGIINGHCKHDGDRYPNYNGPAEMTDDQKAEKANWNCNFSVVTGLLAIPTQEQIEKANRFAAQLNSNKRFEQSNPNPRVESQGVINPIATVFPNPFHESVNVLLGEDWAFAKSVTLEVMNIAGQVVQQQAIDPKSTQYQLVLNNQPAGIYLIRISAEGIAPEVHKVVKR